jgi:16S rRNA C967 or C1407 C5-methylase (RsmB/RsmF family)
LVEVPEASLNGLVLRKGVQSWRVADYDPSSPGGNPQTKTNHNTIEAIDDKGEEEDASSDGGDNNNDDEETLAELRWHDSYRGAVESGMEGARESMWPREVDGEKPVVPLHRCLRLLPQDQDTGGFFVALIRRTK